MPKHSSGSVKVFYPLYKKAELIGLLQKRIPALSKVLPLKRVVLFGSWAKERATAFSDVDLLVIYADPPRQDAYCLVRRSLSLRGLEPHVYSEQEAEPLKAILERMIKDGIVVFSGE